MQYMDSIFETWSFKAYIKSESVQQLTAITGMLQLFITYTFINKRYIPTVLNGETKF